MLVMHFASRTPGAVATAAALRGQLRAASVSGWKGHATPFTGNELHCLEMKALQGDSLAFGNSVRSLGMLRGATAFVSARAGGTNTQLTDMVRKGRRRAFEKMLGDVKERGCDGVLGVSTTIGPLGGLVEFISYGAGVRKMEDFDSVDSANDYKPRTSKGVDGDVFSTTCGGEQYYCLREAGFHPKSVVFGNEAYSTGLLRAVRGQLKQAVLSGELKGMTEVFNASRSNALARLREDAFAKGCNFVSGVRMQAVRMPFIQEVAFSGTACYHPDLPRPATPDDVMTSAVPEEELWSLIAIGKRPIAVLTGSSVHNLGLGRSITASIQQVKGGEAAGFTDLTAQARQAAMKQLHAQAAKLGADEVVSVRIVVEELKYGMVEFFAYGTAVKNDSKIDLPTTHLPPQVLMGKRKQFSTTSNIKSFGERTSEVGHVKVKSESVGLARFGRPLSAVRWVLAQILDLLGVVFPFLSRMSRAIYSKKK